MYEEPLVPVAQYLRMSTSYQRYSLDNQAAALSQYAFQHGMVVVQTYSDPGCSGLELKHRPGLRQLLQDVVSKPLYKAIIVYDVSRWGRFQDPDEAAHYEFVCKSAGVPVHYSSELFENDGSVANLLLKQLKRTMAGEYSRELGVKVHAGQKRLAKMGHKMGGVAGYGLRRCLVTPEGTRRVLEAGQCKTLTTDWVVLVPGPASEVKLVRQMFKLVDTRALHPAEITRRLNYRGLVQPSGTPWTHHNITEILTNPKYVGVNVWGRTTRRLKSRTSAVPTSEWAAKEGAFEPVINRALFDRVQLWLDRRTEHQSNDDLLEDLRRLLRRSGRLSQRLVSMSDLTPNPCTYARRFGSLLSAYELIGYKAKPDCNAMISRRGHRNTLRDDLIASFHRTSPDRIKIVRSGTRRKPMLLIDGATWCAVTICPSLITAQGNRRWLVRVREEQKHYSVLICVLDRENLVIARMYVCPPSGRASWHLRQEHDPWFCGHIRIRSGAELCSALSQYR